MANELQEWCDKASKLLGTVRGSSRVSAISRNDLRHIRHHFEASAALLRSLSSAYPGYAGKAAALSKDYIALVKRLEAAKDPEQTRQLDGEVVELNASIESQLVAARAATRRGWTQQLERLPKMQARDALLNLEWIERDLKRTEVDSGGDWPKQVASVRSELAESRQQVSGQLKSQLAENLKRWRQEIEAAKAKNGGALLADINRLEEEVQAARANFKACAVELPGEVNGLGIAALHTLYEQGFPKRTEGAKANKVDVKDVKAPELKSKPEDMLQFYAGEHVQMNWFTLKKSYKAGKVSDEQMQQAWAFRQSVVDAYMKSPIEATYKLSKGKGWNAVGSVTMESDIDVSILDHHWDEKHEKVLKTDAAIVKEFNDWFLGKYGAQPGVMFDVNLYASAKPRKSLPGPGEGTPVQQAMVSMSNAGQDVGALMKMRRYMSWEEYQAYQDSITGQMEKDGASKEDVQTTVKQFEEADALYQISLAESLNKAKALIEARIEANKKEPSKNPAPTPEMLEALKMVDHELKAAAKATGAEAQKILQHAAHELEHMQDVMMWVNNELYTQGIAEVRQLEEEADKLQKAIDALPQEDQAASSQARELAGVMARLKTLATDSVFFANEAYHSEGPFQHIVIATQGVKSDLERELAPAKPTPEQITEESKKRRDKLSVHLVLQSFNEQLGDLLKDLAHYAGEPNPGVGLYRASKYLQRLLDSLALLNAKVEGLGLDFDPAAKAADVEKTLLAARKGLIAFDKVEGAEALERETQAYAIEQMEALFGVKTLGAVAAHFKQIAAKVNATARKALANEMRAAKEQEKAYFPS